MRAVSLTRTRSLQAAVELVGSEGLRALTHGRVDEKAALPRGSTSNFFRSRQALLVGVVNHIVEQELQMVQPIFHPGSPEELIDVLCGLIDFTTGPNRVPSTARIVLFMEASHDPAIREPVAKARAVMETSITGALRHLGARQPQVGAAALMACAEGIILHRLAHHDATDARPIVSMVARSALA